MRWLACALVLLASAAEAAGPRVGPDAIASWTMADDARIAGYELLIGWTAGGPYPLTLDVGLTDAVRIVELGLSPGQYYAVVRAYDATRETYSALSNEAPFRLRRGRPPR